MTVFPLLNNVLRAAERLAEARQHLAASLHLYGPGGDAVQMAALGALLLLLSAALRRALRPARAPVPELQEEGGRP